VLQRRLPAVLIALAGCGTTVPPAHELDASRDAALDAGPSCEARLLALDPLRTSAAQCAADGGPCGVTVDDFCCPLVVVDANGATAKAYVNALAAYRKAGCAPPLCSAIPCASLPSACAQDACTQRK
jgi:hypothetical protein